MAIDHTQGGGKRHRAKLKTEGGRGFYHWLIKNGFPEGFRVLCHNCNNALGFYGYCPHSGKTQNKPEDCQLDINNPNILIASPSTKSQSTIYNLHAIKGRRICRNCRTQYNTKGAYYHSTLGFCSIKCHEEWRKKAKRIRYILMI